MFLWNLTLLASRLLPSWSERETLLGDIEERELHGSLRGLGEVLALVSSRQLRLWATWRPWLACLAFMPALTTLMDVVFSISSIMAKYPWKRVEPFTPNQLWAMTVSAVICTAIWSWCAGFGFGKIVRRSWLSSAVVVICGGILVIVPPKTAEPLEAALLTILFAFLFVGAPVAFGLVAGLQSGGLQRRHAAILAVASLGSYAACIIQQPGWSFEPAQLLVTVLFLWPLLLPMASLWWPSRASK